MAAALAQLVRPPPPPSLMGCAMFDGDATARGARKGRRGAEDAPTLEAWTALQRAVQDAAPARAMVRDAGARARPRATNLDLAPITLRCPTRVLEV